MDEETGKSEIICNKPKKIDEYESGTLYLKNRIGEDTPVGHFVPDETWLNEFDGMIKQLEDCSNSELPEMYLKLCAITSQCVRGVSCLSKVESIEHEACMYMCSDFSKRIDIQEFCRKHGWGYDNFRKIFKQHMCMSPNQYRIRRRMEAARALLMQRELSIETISESLGYCTPYEFSAKFKASMGMSPSAFRKQQTMKAYVDDEKIQAKEITGS